MKKKDKKLAIIVIVITVILIGIVFFYNQQDNVVLKALDYCGATITGCCGTGLTCYNDPNDNSNTIGRCDVKGYSGTIEEGDKCQ